MPMTASELDTWLKEQAATKLDTFSKTITITATVWTQGTWDGLVSGHTVPGAFGSASTTSAQNQTFSHGYDESVFNGDLSSEIGTGLVADADDVTASIANTVQSTVDAIESVIGDVSFNAQVCHNSCHTSCHTSRGRR